MKKILCALIFFFNVSFAHSIPNEILTFLADNPDASQEQLDQYIKTLELEESLETWDGSDNPEVFNLPPQLVNFLLKNPDANEPEILKFINNDPELINSQWKHKIMQLLAGYQNPNDAEFTLNDLALLNQLGNTFDEVYVPELNWWQFALNYIKLGFKHILEGLDHVLFVASLVLLLPPAKKVGLMITVFTLAHSVTLILGGTNLLTLSPKVVEPLIAASIVYVCVVNVLVPYFLALTRKKSSLAKNHTPSIFIIFLFGLLHGLGFAGVFAEVASGTNRLLPSLLFFNIGVELGQLVILAVFIPFLWSLKTFKLDRYFVPCFAVLITGLASWWMVVRVLF